MNLISALKKFGKVTKKSWKADNDGSHVFFEEGFENLRYRERGDKKDSIEFDFDEDCFLADDWVEYIECSACNAKHTCGMNNEDKEEVL
jgi:hypothetical protein